MIYAHKEETPYTHKYTILPKTTPFNAWIIITKDAVLVRPFPPRQYAKAEHPSHDL
jgi:hypothetical protein